MQREGERNYTILSWKTIPAILAKTATVISQRLGYFVWILMEDEQFQYLSGIMKHPSGTNTKEMPRVPISQTSTNMQNPEDVIQRILEGTLHEDLQSLDTSLDSIPPPKSTSMSRDDKGKGKLCEPIPPPSTNAASTIREQQTKGSSSSSLSSVGRFVRKSTLTSPDSNTLDSRDEKNLAKTAVLISQLEYEDEYDDSFDDLGFNVADSGVEESETLGERMRSNRVKPWETETGSSAPSDSSKWNSRKKPQFYVKDGKNYSYKVADSVAVANYNEAAIVNQAQRELIHGLGRGGNLPLGAVKKLMESNEEVEDEGDATEGGGRGNRGRGRGRRGGGRNNYRKDQAMKKHFAGVTGH
ncbi:ubiquitin system component Cue protein [Actinidia rufa]|uniref:Ubiquitin system component Cue protein n=1 Tax=Actinidia rufa TaxID=165716 RepID=A0A7J0DX58_9ERIC|nr:ubiquitin system component Cue protein [Actinidia rufa]